LNDGAGEAGVAKLGRPVVKVEKHFVSATPPPG